MKSILSVVESYLRKFPAPAGIEMISNNLLKLNYSFSTPYTNSKNVKQTFLPINQIELGIRIDAVSKKLKYDQKGRIQEVGAFDSISVQGKHEKILQDDVFGYAKLSSDKNRWVYVAQVKEEKLKGYFNNGQGKTHFEYDFGQTYQGVKNAKIFVWDKKKRQVFKIQTSSSLIPACPVFSNQQGSKIIFHAYNKTEFGHGLLHCFNRNVSIYDEFSIEEQVQDAEKQAELTKNKLKCQKERLSKLPKLIEDGQRTNIFPSISKCYDYLIYCSGSGITHTYYLDLVVMKRTQNGWKQLHRLKELLVGYYCTLKFFPTTDSNGKPICYFQTIDGGVQKIYRLDLESGKTSEFSKNQSGQSFAISQLLESGRLLGTVTTHNFNTFFYSNNQNSALELVPPPEKEDFILEQYFQPIHGYYLQAKQQSILPEYRSRCKSRPMIFLVHGGPHGAVDPAFTLFRYSALKMGYSILMPNFPGSAGYGKEYLQKALKNIGQTDMNHMISLLERVLKEKSHLDKSKVHVYGGSFGGYSGGILGSRYSQYFKSAIILNGVLSIPGQLFFTDIPEWNTVETLGKEDLHNLTAEDYAEMYRQSPISQPMKIPVLQFLGAKDLRVPYRQGLLFDAITKKQGTQITTYVYENSSHSLADSVETIVDVVVKSLLFMEGSLAKSEKKAQEQLQKAEEQKIIAVKQSKVETKAQAPENAEKVQQKMKENQNL